MDQLNFRLATADVDTAAAMNLVADNYAAQGYRIDHLKSPAPEFVLVAEDENGVVATLTLRTDGPHRLAADAGFSDVLDRHRNDRVHLVEVSRFASRRRLGINLLAEFLHYCADTALAQEDAVTFIIEVNPKHEGFYRRLGFIALSRGTCDRVDAPAILMQLSSERLTTARRADTFRATSRTIQQRTAPLH